MTYFLALSFHGSHDLKKVQKMERNSLDTKPQAKKDFLHFSSNISYQILLRPFQKEGWLDWKNNQ